MVVSSFGRGGSFDTGGFLAAVDRGRQKKAQQAQQYNQSQFNKMRLTGSKEQARSFAIDRGMWDQVKSMDDESRAMLLNTHKALSRAAQAAKALPIDQRAGFAKFALQQQGFNPQAADLVDDWSDQRMDAIARESLAVEDQLGQLMTERSQAEKERAGLAGEALQARKIDEDVRSNKASESIKRYSAQTDRLSQQERARANRAGEEAAKAKAPSRDSGAEAARRALESRLSRVNLISSAIDKAIDQAGTFNTGYVAGRSASPTAQNLRATLDQIKANIGFEELQRMRDNSPTGGALGQVTEREIAFLQSVLGSLDQLQSADQLRDNLRIAKAEIEGAYKRIADAYEKDYNLPSVSIGDEAPSEARQDVRGLDYKKQLAEEYGLDL